MQETLNVCTLIHAQIRGPDPPPLNITKNIDFHSNTGPDPLKNHKATKAAFSVGPSSARQQNALNGVSLAGR